LKSGSLELLEHSETV